jgi:Flp pilus assembly protein TadG
VRQASSTPRQRLRGVAAIELAITMVPVLMVAFGVTEYGRAIYTYNAIDKAARDATRYLTAPFPGDPDPVASARNIAVYGNETGTGQALVPGLSTSMVNVCNASLCSGTHKNVPTGNGVVNLVTVKIEGYVHNSIVTYVAPATIPFNAISVTMRTNL